MDVSLPAVKVEALRGAFGTDLLEEVPLARYTSARIGGPADFLVIASSAEQLANIARILWDLGAPFRLLGGGSNILVADSGFRGVVVINQARAARFWEVVQGPRLEAESGTTLSSLTRRAVERGWAGLEWAINIPGTLGGALVGNAGAYGGDIAGNLEVAEILQQNGCVEQWFVDRMEYAYRDSWFKRNPGQAVVLKATLRLDLSTPEETKVKMGSYMAQRKRTQPSGASMGSIFKNPQGEYAGRLIEAVGLKGAQQGAAQISPLHGNYFMNLGGASAADIWALIQIAREHVAAQFGIELDLEIEFFGDWDVMRSNAVHTHEGGEA